MVWNLTKPANDVPLNSFLRIKKENTDPLSIKVLEKIKENIYKIAVYGIDFYCYIKIIWWLKETTSCGSSAKEVEQHNLPLDHEIIKEY